MGESCRAQALFFGAPGRHKDVLGLHAHARVAREALHVGVPLALQIVSGARIILRRKNPIAQDALQPSAARVNVSGYLHPAAVQLSAECAAILQRAPRLMTVLGKVGPLMEFFAFRLGSHCWQLEVFEGCSQHQSATVEVAEVLQR